jgi:hypothetical protein
VPADGDVRFRVDPRGVVIAAAFAALGAQAGDRLSLSIVLTDGDGQVVEQQPGHEPLELVVPDRHHDAIHWLV